MLSVCGHLIEEKDFLSLDLQRKYISFSLLVISSSSAF
jgi:hypothetical protein